MSRSLASTTPRVAVILVNHHDYARQYLPDCYASLSAQTYPADRFGLFIVNNAVTPPERAWVAQTAPTARLLDNAGNPGWAGGNNTAIRVALQEGHDACVMLNIDTIVAPDWLERLVEAAQTRPDVQILQSLILLHGTDRINSRGNRLQFLGFGYCLGYGQERETLRQPQPMDYASGAAMLVAREVFEAIGLFEESYFMYYDDVEFCWRARLAGFNVGLAERSVCHHKYRFATTLQFLYHLERNRLRMLVTMARLGTLAIIAPALVASEAVLTLYFLARGWGAVRWRLWREWWRPATWRAMAARRRTVQALRRRRDADIVRGFAGRVVFAEVNPPILRYLCNPLLALYWALARRVIVW